MKPTYLGIQLNALQLQGGDVLADATTNTHYDGESPLWSKRHETGGGDVETGFEHGSARINDLGGTPSTDYYHTDMLGTTRFLTDLSGGQIEPAVYTAFGELVSGTSGRFGYVGAQGYQTSDEMPYQHVGNRYYDPTTGRFLQRDPIGILGGRNIYAYAGNAPTNSSDPSGNGPPKWAREGKTGPDPTPPLRNESRMASFFREYNSPEQKRQRQATMDHWKRQQENPSTYFYDDMKLDLEIRKMNVKMSRLGLSCVAGGWAIYTESIVGGALAVANALSALW